MKLSLRKLGIASNFPILEKFAAGGVTRRLDFFEQQIGKSFPVVIQQCLATAHGETHELG